MAITQITPEEAFEMANNKGMAFVDVREKHETDDLKYDLPNIIYLPMSEFETKHKTLLPTDKEAPLIIACRSGGRSMRIAEMLKKLGYKNLHNLDGGILDWSECQLPCK